MWCKLKNVMELTWPSRRTRNGRGLTVHQLSLGLEDYHPLPLCPLLRHGARVLDGAAEFLAAAAPASAPPGSVGGPVPVLAHSQWTI